MTRAIDKGQCLIGAYGFRGLESVLSERRRGTGAAGSLFLDHEAERGRTLGMASKPTPGTYLQQAPTSEYFPRASNSCGPIIQTQDPVEASLIQTTIPGFFTGWQALPGS